MQMEGEPSRLDSPDRADSRIRGMNIFIFHHGGNTYRVDAKGFLLFPEEWDEAFAVGKAASVGIERLTDEHWKVIRFIRNTFKRINQCPLVYVACRNNHLGLGEFKRLFPTGYLRGACKLAGVTYREAYLQQLYLEENVRQLDYWYENRSYSVDIRGFLVEPAEWDEHFAIHKAYEMKMPEYLTDRHFRVIYYLRDRFRENCRVPTVIETCEALNLELDQLEELFPSGYHRGAVKLAGLRVTSANHGHHVTVTEPPAPHVKAETAGADRLSDARYSADSDGFLPKAHQWDSEFAVQNAERVGIRGGLTKEHWDVIHFIRTSSADQGRCPLVYETCRQCGLSLKDLKRLFPTGYLRGACKLAGITYQEGYMSQSNLPATGDDRDVLAANKTYKVDVRGFLVDPDDWDEYYAAFRAYDMKIAGGKLGEDHWKIIHFLRDRFTRDHEVPTVIETCEANGIDLDELERLFPDGYHRGAVKIAGLRVR